MIQQYALLFLWMIASAADAFLPVPGATTGSFVKTRGWTTSTCSTWSSALPMAGFGAAASKKDDKKKGGGGGGGGDVAKLKPRQQWDRYTDLKGADSVVVGVRVLQSTSPVKLPEGEGQGQEWFKVGTIKSQDNAYTEAAVIRQRPLISEHARRLFPLKIFPKDTLEWGYMKGEEMVVAGKVDMPDDIEKMIGFVGLPDETGFYMKIKEPLIDNTASGFSKMKKKGIVGFTGMEVHD